MENKFYQRLEKWESDYKYGFVTLPTLQILLMLGIGGSIAYLLYHMVEKVDKSVTSTKAQVEHTLSSVALVLLPVSERVVKMKQWYQKTKEKWRNIFHRRKVQETEPEEDHNQEDLRSKSAHKDLSTSKQSKAKDSQHAHHHAPSLREKVDVYFTQKHKGTANQKKLEEESETSTKKR